MAKTTIAGDAIVITSAMKLEDLHTIQKYRPKALTLMGGEDGKEPIFAIGLTDGSGNLNEFSASFGRETRDDAKLATVTLMIVGSEVSGDIKEWVADKIGGAIMNLNKLEATLPAVLEEIKSEKAEILSNIDIAQ